MTRIIYNIDIVEIIFLVELLKFRVLHLSNLVAYRIIEYLIRDQHVLYIYIYIFDMR